jgi:predicted TIM-barrel fold metal-dependent hydrolase
MKPTRRAVVRSLVGSAAVALVDGRGRAAAGAPPIVVDIHCHVFNGADLPITGFLAHFIPGLSDVSRELTPVPESIVRFAIGQIHQGFINRVAPDVAGERAYLAELAAANGGRGALAAPVGFIADPGIQATYQRALSLIADQLGGLPLLHPDPAKVRATLDRVARVLYLVSHERARIAATMATTYPEVSLFTPLLVDYDAWSDDKPAVPLRDQIDIHAEVARASMRDRIGRVGARFHPFVAFDPLREARAQASTIGGPGYRPYGDARVFVPGARYQPAVISPPAAARLPPHPEATAGGIALARYAIETAGFIGCKLYPPVGFAPLDNEHLLGDAQLGKRLDTALRAFYAYCEAEEVPITAHASAGNEYGLGFRALVAPSRWEPVLREFPRLRLNLGHFGQDEGIDAKLGAAAPAAWIRQAAALMAAYPNVYADLSNSPLVYDEGYATRFLGWLDEIFRRYPAAKQRVMYGSDYWLSRLDPGADDAVKRFTAKLTARFGAAACADVMGTNALRFLGMLDDQGRKPAQGRNRARLRRFYGGLPQPAWLGD